LIRAIALRDFEEDEKQEILVDYGYRAEEEEQAHAEEVDN
jgi:hypothetical protein